MKLMMLTALAALTVTTQGALALGQKECAVQAGLVMQVVAARSAGAESGAATQSVQATLDDATQHYATIVPAVVDWVYALPQSQLGDEVGNSWTAACMQQ